MILYMQIGMKFSYGEYQNRFKLMTSANVQESAAFILCFFA